MAGVVADDVDLAAGRVGDGDKAAGAGGDRVGELEDVLLGGNAVGGHVEAESVEDIRLSGLRGVNLVLLVLVNVRDSVFNGSNAIICLITNMKTPIRSYRQTTDKSEQTVHSEIVVGVEAVTR